MGQGLLGSLSFPLGLDQFLPRSATGKMQAQVPPQQLFQSSLGTPPSVGVASAAGVAASTPGRATAALGELGRAGLPAANFVRPCVSSGTPGHCSHHTAPRSGAAAGASRAPHRRRGGRCCHFLAPAPRREEECKGARLAPHRLLPPRSVHPRAELQGGGEITLVEVGPIL